MLITRLNSSDERLARSSVARPGRPVLCGVALLWLWLAGGAVVHAQGERGSAATPDTVHLEVLRAAAVQQDPRAVQPALLAAATQLRLENLRATRRPQLAVSGQATYQNEVLSLPFEIPGQHIPLPPQEQWRAQAELEWRVFDGGRTRQQMALERARLAEHQAGVTVSLYALREATTEAYFGALLLQAQAQTLALAAEDLEARLALVRRQAAEGVVLTADAALLEAEAIRVRQQQAEAEASRRAALAVLAHLTGLPITGTDVLALPDHAAAAATDPQAIERPELVQFARTTERLEAEARAAEAATRPELSLFGQAGIGRPSPFNFLNDEARPFALAGARLRWAPFDWGQAQRRAAALRLQGRLAETEAAAFSASIRRNVEDERQAIARLEAALIDDARAVALREEVLRVAHHQLEEGTLLPPAYTDRLTDLAEARLTWERHRVELAQVRARLLSTLGRFPDLDDLPPDTETQ